VEESEVEDATNFYIKAGSVELKTISDSIRDIYRKFGGEIDSVQVSPKNLRDLMYMLIYIFIWVHIYLNILETYV
jgi:hypothetical protein